MEKHGKPEGTNPARKGIKTMEKKQPESKRILEIEGRYLLENLLNNLSWEDDEEIKNVLGLSVWNSLVQIQGDYRLNHLSECLPNPTEYDFENWITGSFQGMNHSVWLQCDRVKVKFGENYTKEEINDPHAWIFSKDGRQAYIPTGAGFAVPVDTNRLEAFALSHRRSMIDEIMEDIGWDFSIRLQEYEYRGDTIQIISNKTGECAESDFDSRDFALGNVLGDFLDKFFHKPLKYYMKAIHVSYLYSHSKRINNRDWWPDINSVIEANQCLEPFELAVSTIKRTERNGTLSFTSTRDAWTI